MARYHGAPIEDVPGRDRKNPTPPRLVIIGSGGLSREILNVVLASRATGTSIDLLGFVDDDPTASVVGLERLGGLDRLEELDARYALSSMDPSVRHRLDVHCTERGLEPLTLVHPRSPIGASSTLGPGAFVGIGAGLTVDAHVGRHGVVDFSFLGHGARMGAYSTCAMSCRVNGNVTIGEGVTIGTGSTINPGRSIGSHAVIAPGSVVVKDVPAGAIVAGNPAQEAP